MTLTQPLKFVLIALVAAAAWAVAAPAAHAASFYISPDVVEPGAAAVMSWSCDPAHTAHIREYTQGQQVEINPSNTQSSSSGDVLIYPTAYTQYELTCRNYANQVMYLEYADVDVNGCYVGTSVSVQPEAVYEEYNDSLVPENVIFDETGENASNGGGIYDDYHYQACINQCSSYGTCNYKATIDFASTGTSLTRFTCTFVDPLTGGPNYKATVNTPPSSGSNGMPRTTTMWTAIQWSPSEGGSCEVPPPSPTVNLVANPTTISNGGTSRLTWTSTNADTCVGIGFNTNNAVQSSGLGVPVSPGSTTDYQITCFNESGSASDTARVTVGNAPDLVAGGVTASPSTIVIGQPASLSATTTNSGLAGTGTSFPVLFQAALSSSGSGAKNLGTVSTNAHAAGASRLSTLNIDTNQLETGGTWYVRACADKTSGGDVNGQIAESNEENNCGPWGPVTVTTQVVTAPNLVAENLGPSSAQLNQATTFTATVRNSGTGATASGFTSIIQFDDNANHATVHTTKTVATPLTAAGASSQIQTSMTFTSGTTWYARACADQNASYAGTIAESNEGDNCTSWQPITVGSAASTLTCQVAPSSITVGGTATFTASPTGLGVYLWTPSETGEPLSGPANRDHDVVRTYNSVGTYGMTVVANGQTASCPTVAVGSPCSNPTPSITASPDRVNVGQTSTLTISATGVSGSCTLSGPGVSQSLTANACNVAEVDVVTPAITTQSVYTLTCGAATAQAVVNVIPSYEVF